MTWIPWQKIYRIFLLLPLAISLACNRPSTQTSQEPVKTQVLVAVVPLGDLVRQVGGVYVVVDSICEAGQDPRDIKMTDDLRRRVAKADLTVVSGYGDLWASGGMGGLAEADRVIRPELTTAGQARPIASADLWLDPAVARELIEVIRERLSIRDAKHKDVFRDNATQALRRLDDLDATLRKDFAPLKGKRFVVLRPSWAAFATRYGLEEIAPIDSRPDQLSDDDARRLRAAAKKAGTDTLVVDASLISGVVHQLESQTGLKLLLLDRLGSSAPESRNTYDKIMEYNRKQLIERFK